MKKLLVASFMMCACAGTGTTGSGSGSSQSFGACAKADLTQILKSNGLSILSTVAGIVFGQNPDVEGQVVTIATEAGKDIVRCAIDAARAVYDAQRGKSTSSGPDPIAVRFDKAKAAVK